MQGHVYYKSKKQKVKKVVLFLYRCSCGHCDVMPSLPENTCCREKPQVEAILEDYKAHCSEAHNLPGCITEHPGFASGCLDVWTLQIAYLQYKQDYGNMHHPLNE